MSTAPLTYDYRNAPVVLPEASLKAPSLKWKWSTEGELEVDFFVVKSAWHRPVSHARIGSVAEAAGRSVLAHAMQVES